PPPPRDQRGGSPLRNGDSGMPKWGLWALLGLTLAIVLSSSFMGSGGGDEISYSEFMAEVRDGNVESIKVDNTNGDITGELDDGSEFTTTGPLDGGIPDSDLSVLREQDVKVEYRTPQPGFLVSLL